MYNLVSNKVEFLKNVGSIDYIVYKEILKIFGINLGNKAEVVNSSERRKL